MSTPMAARLSTAQALGSAPAPVSMSQHRHMKTIRPAERHVALAQMGVASVLDALREISQIVRRATSIGHFIENTSQKLSSEAGGE